jgi:hypothetical protein
MAEDQEPVGDVAHGRHRLAPQPRHLPWQEHHAEGQRCHHQHVEGRQEPPRPPEPEALEVDAPLGAPLGEQEGAYEVAANDEEDLHPQEAARHPGELGVVEEDRTDGEGAQAVQAGAVGQPHLGGAGLTAGACEAFLDAGRGVGYLRLSQRLSLIFPPSTLEEMILAQSLEAVTI